MLVLSFSLFVSSAAFVVPGLEATRAAVLHNYYSCRGLQIRWFKGGDNSLGWEPCFTGFALASRMLEVQWVPLPVKVIQQAFIAMDEDLEVSRKCVCVVFFVAVGGWLHHGKIASLWCFQHGQFLSAKTYMTNFQLRYHSPLHRDVISFWHLPQILSLKNGLLSAQLLVSQMIIVW